MNGFAFRYLGREERVMKLYRAFREQPGRALHPMQLARATGLDMFEVERRLRGCSEVFVRMPKRPDGTTRYRLTSAVSSLPEEEVRRLVRSRARTERWTLYSVVLIVASLLLALLLTVVPATQMGFFSS